MSKRPIPVLVVTPSPNLDTPITLKFSYDGSDTNTLGVVYPVPPPPTVNDRVPPAPTVADIVAAAPVCPF